MTSRRPHAPISLQSIASRAARALAPRNGAWAGRRRRPRGETAPRSHVAVGAILVKHSGRAKPGGFIGLALVSARRGVAVAVAVASRAVGVTSRFRAIVLPRICAIVVAVVTIRLAAVVEIGFLFHGKRVRCAGCPRRALVVVLQLWLIFAIELRVIFLALAGRAASRLLGIRVVGR